MTVGLDSNGNIYTPIEAGGGKLPCGYFTKKDKVYFSLIWRSIEGGIVESRTNHAIHGTKKGRK
jgi:hypothetical protein